jgi:hypothetical protein
MKSAPGNELELRPAGSGEAGSDEAEGVAVDWRHPVSAKLLDVTADEYHAIEAFSSSTAKIVLERSPGHARIGLKKKPTKSLDGGNIIHRLLLGKGKGFDVIQHGDYKTKAAQAKRDAARDAGLVPVLAHEMEGYATAAEAIRVQLADRGIVLDGVSEQAITWVEKTPHGDVLCKGMMDHVWPDVGIILDIKTCEDASQAAIERAAEKYNYAVQSTAYSRALVALDPDLAGRVAFSFAFCETSEPHAVNVTEPDGPFQELGLRRWLRAVNIWAECAARNHWPTTYGANVNPLSPPSWALAREGFTADER